MHLAQLSVAALTTLAFVPSNVFAAEEVPGPLTGYTLAPPSMKLLPDNVPFDRKPYFLWSRAWSPEVKMFLKNCEVHLVAESSLVSQDKGYARYDRSVSFPKFDFTVTVKKNLGNTRNPCEGDVDPDEIPRGFYISIVEQGLDHKDADAFVIERIPDAIRCYVALTGGGYGSIANEQEIAFGKVAFFHRHNLKVRVDPVYVGPHRRKTCKGTVVEGRIPTYVVVLVAGTPQGLFEHEQELTGRGN